MSYTEFFDQVPPIKLYDPLGEFLGAFSDGMIEISYRDCVKLAGHSCPTVASAYLMTKLGLTKLYPEALPIRGEIKVELRSAKDDGVTGVIANIVSYIVGAGDNGGFQGIKGKFSRKDLISFGISNISGAIKLTRVDTGYSVVLNSDTKHLPVNPQMMPMMQQILQDEADSSQIENFRNLWQKRVEMLLLNMDIQNRVITIGE